MCSMFAETASELLPQAEKYSNPISVVVADIHVLRSRYATL